MELRTNGVHPPTPSVSPTLSEVAPPATAAVLPPTLSQFAQQRLRALATGTSEMPLDPLLAAVLAQCADESAHLRAVLEHLAHSLATGDGDAARAQLALVLAPCHQLDACQEDFVSASNAMRDARTALDALLPDAVSPASLAPDPTALRSLATAARVMVDALEILALNAQTWADQLDPAAAVPDA